ncbi:hypothetical protein SFUMM280S_10127 [Streptomyces fumanus]
MSDVTVAAHESTSAVDNVMVDVHGVHKSFGPLEVLRGVDLKVRAGEVTVIVGPSGSGKSTLLRTINHLEKVNRGWISIDGELIGYRRSGSKLHELKEKDVLRQRTHIGFVFQNFNLFPHLTVLDNLIEAPVAALRRSRKAAEESARSLLKRVGLADKADAYPASLGRPAAARGHRPCARPPTEGTALRRTHLGARPPNWSARSLTSSRIWPAPEPP